MSLSFLQKYGDVAMLILRLIVGAVFIGHGLMKVGAWSQPAVGMNLLMMVLSVAEPFAGIALILGIVTRWAALGLSVVMIGAIIMKQFVWGGGFINPQMAWEFDAVILGGLLVLLCYGAGRLSLEVALHKETTTL